MNKLVSTVWLAACCTLMVGNALAQSATPGSNAAAPGEGSLPVIGTPSAAGTPGASAAIDIDKELQNRKVYTANGVRVGTVVSATAGDQGAFITIEPMLTFMTPPSEFQVALPVATPDNDQVTLSLTDTSLRSALAASQST